MSAPTTAEVWASIESMRMARSDPAARIASNVLHSMTLPLAEDRDRQAAEVARLKAILECGSSPYGMHRCCHCDSEVT